VSAELPFACKPAFAGLHGFIFHNFFCTNSEASHYNSNVAIPNIMTEPTKHDTMDKQQAKRVSFYACVKCRKLPYIQPEEVLNTWYLPEDFVAARKYERVLRTYISEHREQYLKNEEKMCALGLRTENEKRTKLRAIRASIRAVLTEQHRQGEQFLDATQNDDDAIFYLDDQNISTIYSLYALASSRQALSRGLVHERHVKDITPLQTTMRILDTSFGEPLPVLYYSTMQEYKPQTDMNSPLHLFLRHLVREKTADCEAESLRIRIVFDDAPGSDGYKNQQTLRSNNSKQSRKVTRWLSSYAGDKDLTSVMQSRPLRYPTRPRSESACSA
jgi:hypothetical protein